MVGFLGDEMKIGVMLRHVNDRYTLNEEILDVITFFGGEAVCFTHFHEDILNFVDGVILQGGEDYTNEDLKTVSYLFKKDIPTLGICLGMQTMGVFLEGALQELPTTSHYQPEKLDVHEIKVDTNSQFYDIINKDKVIVNSRHHEALTHTKASITGISSDGVIEIIEDNSRKFFIGVQWHPETNFLHDSVSLKLFQAFFDTLSR